MYDSPEMTTQDVDPRGRLVGGGQLAAMPESALQSALSNQGEQIGKLGELINQLATRLTPIRNLTPQKEPANGDAMPSCSPVVEIVVRRTEEVKYLQARVAEMLQDLEV